MEVKFQDGTAMDTCNDDYSYNYLVKKRLIEWKDNFEKSMGGVTLNYRAIADEMKTRFNIKTTTSKIGAMFDITKDRTIQLQELFALSQLFDIPIWDICAHPSTITSSMNYGNLVRRKRKADLSVHPLDSPFYAGDYWCYYFNPKHSEGQLRPVEELAIEEAKLSIQIESGRTVVTLEEQKATTAFDGSPMPSFTLQGDLYHFQNTNIAYGFIADSSNRRAMALMFTYLNLSADIRYYITAGMMTFSLNQTHTPLFQKMAVFRNRQPYKEYDVANVLRGILSLNSCPIAIDSETYQSLISHNSAWKTVLAPEKAMAKCLVYSEVSVRESLFNIKNENEKTKMLLELRKNSLLPAHEVVAEPDYFADFIKQFQIETHKEHVR